MILIVIIMIIKIIILSTDPPPLPIYSLETWYLGHERLRSIPLLPAKQLQYKDTVCLAKRNCYHKVFVRDKVCLANIM